VTLGTGGVSLFAVQFAVLLGAEVIALTSSEDKARRLKALGAHEVLHRTPDWPAAVRERTGGRGAGHVVDVAGDLSQSLRAVAVAGEVALVGFIGGDVPPLDPRLLFGSGASVRPIAVGSQAQFRAMNRAIEAGGLRPVVDREFAFEDAAEAFRYYENEQPLGKVVITAG
jgi:NADPH:quinone reductase-like Zn-dependent oxidoreductase